LGISGILLAADGTLSGTPTQQGTFMPNFTVTDSSGKTATAAIELDAVAPFTFSTTPALPDVNIALPVWVYIAGSGGVLPYNFTVAQGSSLPPGLTFTNSNGVGLIQGIPTTPGNYAFTVHASDSFTPPFQISQTFTVRVLNGLVAPNPALPDAVQNVAYREQILVAGGTPPYHFVLLPNASMPPGLLLNTSSGIVSGTPTASSQFTDFLYLTITDSAPSPASISPAISLNVQPALSFQTTSLPDSARGLNYSGTVAIVGGRAPYSLLVATGALPDGVSISPTPYGNSFSLTGVPTKDGVFQFKLEVTDSYETQNAAIQSFQVRISDQMVLSGPNLAEILYNQSYSTTFPITGGLPPYTWNMNPVPPGFNFDTTKGILSSGSDPGGSTNSVISAHDSSNPPLTSNYLDFSMIVDPKIKILTSSLPIVATGSTIWLGLATSGLAVPNQWSISSGSLPSGMNLSVIDGNATITGTPTQAGTYTFTVGVSNSNTGSLHQSTSQQLTLTVKDRGQTGRNDSTANATILSNISLLASISPYSDPSTPAPDVDYYSLSAVPGSIVQVYASPNNDFLQPPEPNSMQPVIEIVDANGTRYKTCNSSQPLPGQLYNLPCINNLPGSLYLQGNYYSFQVPGSGTAPVTFYLRLSDERGDARPDFIYTLSVYGVN
jgi:large repetitive protein